jgi:CRISPR-associated protein Csd1
MILQALYEYYQRKPELPAPGFEKKEIPFVIVIDEQGGFIDLQDTREPKGKKLVAKSFLVPKERERSGSNAWQKTNVLWDHYGYVLSHPKSNSAKDVEMARKQHQTFVNQIKTLSDAFPHDVEIKAVLYFLVGGHKEVVFQHPLWEKCSDISGCNLTFRLRGRDQLVCQNDAIQEFASATDTEDEQEEDSNGVSIHGICLEYDFNIM